MRRFVGPLLLALIGVSMIGATYSEGWHDLKIAAVTAAVTNTAQEVPALPWRGVADIKGTTKIVLFPTLFLTKQECDAYLKTNAFKVLYANLVVFLASHPGGSTVGPGKCAQVAPTTPPPPALGDSI